MNEKSISSIISLLDKLHAYNEKFASTGSNGVPSSTPATTINKTFSKSQKRRSFIGTPSISVAGGGGGDQTNDALINGETNGTLNRRSSVVN